ncbi:23S rRNA (adenine(2503)-C(2))-methyltransferase RlmN [Thermotoga sp. 38H-to]|uniref:23S rRNA (adenine(2503)-C(2))-methyltransferase RlmN n=1 Tax=Thermotoga sp. 38H-to TaxID=1755812 RepID=UPI0013EDA4E2|nr:23S rRNA (adenine(2503)-C(2))-methyltransferase RlmN [Thermotoga sp. 38H-to]KAF2960635.1 23S rRNA (adenine(2503)-C2)-methyltransferase [Thermotoga sp. 38H-to]
MKNLLDLSYEELVAKITNLGLERYRADQILDWVFNKKVNNFDEMTNLSKQHRALLKEHFSIPFLKLLDKKVSKIDGTTKFLWELEDANTIESVMLFHPDRVTACISTQVGCPVKCIFCATGMSGFVRNLTTGEIVAQILSMEKEEKKKIGNVVYMGMGEPLLNYENTIKSIRILNHKKMGNIGIRRITISTVGIPDRIIQLAEEGLDVKLALSLHAPTNFKRDQLVPLNKKYSIEEILNAVKIYQKKTGNRVTIEYVLIRGINDEISDAKKLAEILKNMKVFVNLIPVNPTVEGLRRPSRERLLTFKRILLENGVEAEIRREKGSDIEAACGQLRLKRMNSTS